MLEVAALGGRTAHQRGPRELRPHGVDRRSQLAAALAGPGDGGDECAGIGSLLGRDRRDPRIARVFSHYERVARTGDYDVFERVPEGVALTGPPMRPETPTQDILPVNRRNGL